MAENSNAYIKPYITIFNKTLHQCHLHLYFSYVIWQLLSEFDMTIPSSNHPEVSLTLTHFSPSHSVILNLSITIFPLVGYESLLIVLLVSSITCPNLLSLKSEQYFNSQIWLWHFVAQNVKFLPDILRLRKNYKCSPVNVIIWTSLPFPSPLTGSKSNILTCYS